MIFTAGYPGHHLETLARIARKHDALICDIRYTPTSSMPEWRQPNLQRVLGQRYLHLKEWGNINAKTDKPIQIADDAMGLVKLTRLQRKHFFIFLICGCSEYSKCHRHVCADMIRRHRDWKTGLYLDVEEFAWPVAPAPEGHMKCLSLWQPWGTLIAIGAKRIETRSWPTRYRGPVLIHAAKTTQELGVCFDAPFRQVLEGTGYVFELGQPLAKQLPLGAVVAVADLVDCVTTEKLLEEGRVTEQERAFGNYAPRRFGWILENIRALPQPIPTRGYQGLFNVEIDLEQAMSLPIRTPSPARLPETHHVATREEQPEPTLF